MNKTHFEIFNDAKSISFCDCAHPEPEISTDMKFMYCEKCKKWLRPKRKETLKELKQLVNP